MGLSSRDLRLLFQQSGNHCAFPSCERTLTYPSTTRDGPLSTSEVAHIVAESLDGPRGDYPLPLEERNRYENLILLCEEHHHVVDTQIATYPVERLRRMKYDHESLIAEATRKAVATRATDELESEHLITESLYSSLLPVEQLPMRVFSIEWTGSEEDVKARLVRTPERQAASFICRRGRLFCFHDLQIDPGPFIEIAEGLPVARSDATTWWDDPDKFRWYVSLLNRTLNKITGWRGLNLDKNHRRYYFQPDEPGKPKSVKYRPMNRSLSEIQVVWQPITKKTGQPKKYWCHRAVAMTFARVAAHSWCLALCPEMRITRDSISPMDSTGIGAKVTKKKARMWNIDVLEELNFWRAFLFGDSPRLIVCFGSDRSALSVSANFLREDVKWPGVPPESARTFKNAMTEENLFDLAELDRIASANVDIEVEDAMDDEQWQ